MITDTLFNNLLDKAQLKTDWVRIVLLNANEELERINDGRA